MHIQSLKSRIKQFRDEGTFCDTVLESKDGTQFRVHWIVLQYRGVWWTAGRDEKQKHTEVGDLHILLPDVETEDVRSFVNELYGGNVTATAPITIFVSGAPPVPPAPVSRTQPSSAPPLRSSWTRTCPPRSSRRRPPRSSRPRPPRSSRRRPLRSSLPPPPQSSPPSPRSSSPRLPRVNLGTPAHKWRLHRKSCIFNLKNLGFNMLKNPLPSYLIDDENAFL